MSPTLRRSRDVLAVLGGFFVYMVLRENPLLLERYALEILGGLIALLLAFLAFLRGQF